jgi:adenylate cyclase
MERRLAAILAADVVGYSRLMEADEEATLVTLNACREVIDRLVATHRGRVFGSGGDSVIAEFTSPVEAVRCAVEIQQKIEARNADMPEDRRMRFRIGVNLGDVMAENENLFGDGVNVAARLEQLAVPGGIYVSDDLYRQVEGKADVAFDDLGEQRLKNLAKPVRVYSMRLGAGESGATKTPSKGLPIPDRPSIAVLPFANMSGDPEQEYFSDGITEDIIASLSRIGWLFVIARNSSFVFKGRTVDVRRVSNELGVRYILEGSVRKAANRIRVTAQLIDAQSSAHLWVERYDRDLDDIFSVQDEIVGSIVHALGAADGVLEKSERQRSLETQVKNLTAYDCYLQGRDQMDRQGDANFESAEGLLRKAIALDAGFAQAYSALAWLHFLRFKLIRTESFEDIRQKALDLALHSVRLDQNDYRAHWVLGFLYSHEGKHAQGLAQFDRALSINPNDANVLVWSSEVLVYWGRMEDAMERCQRAMRLNPNCPDFYFWMLGFSYFHLGRYEEALAALERMTAPGYARRLLVATYAHLDRLEEARSEAEEYMKVDPDFSITTWAKTEHYTDPTERQRYVDGLRKAGLPD